MTRLVFPCGLLREFPIAFRLLGFFVVSFRRHRLSTTPSCLRCPLEFLVSAFGTYLFVPDLLAFVALKVLSNNHLHLLVIRFAFVVLSFPLSDFPSFVWLFLDFKVLFSTDSHQLGFTDASFRFFSLTAPSSSSVSDGFHTAAPHFQVFSAS